jgi:hypothetical protein
MRGRGAAGATFPRVADPLAGAPNEGKIADGADVLTVLTMNSHLEAVVSSCQ